MRTRLLPVVVATAAVALSATAADGAHRLSLRTANRVADATASAITDAWADDQGTTIDDYQLSACTRAGVRRADCDVTYSLSDGSECDDTIHVTANRRGRLHVSSDSDDGDTQTFADCTDPSTDPTADPGTDTTTDPTADPTANPTADPGAGTTTGP